MEQKPEKQNLTIKRIGEVFSDIDKKILLLNQCSYDDFTIFNNQLKNFNNQLHRLSDNLKNILTQNIQDSDNKNEFETLIDEASAIIDKMKLSFDLAIKEINKFKRNLNSLSVRAKSYKQNLLTFKYLLSNLKIRLVYLNPTNFSVEGILIIDEQINRLNGIIGQLKEIRNFFEHFSMGSIVEVRNITEMLQNEMHKIYEMWSKNESLYSEIEICVNSMNGKISAAASNLGQIITQLQFQDIVRQRMEHIQQMHKQVLEIAEKFDDAEFSCLPAVRQARYVIQLRDIAVLQMGQLSQVNIQYQNAIEVISRIFLSIVENLTDASLLYILNFHVGDKHNLLNGSKMSKSLENTVFYYNQLLSEMQPNINKYENITEVLESYSQCFSNITEIHKKFVDFSNMLIAEIDNTDLTKEERQSIKEYIEHLIINNNIIAEFKILDVQNSEIQKKLLNYLMEVVNLTNNNELNIIINKISKAVERIITGSNVINEIYKTNENISNMLVENVFDAIQQVKYFDLFEREINDIVNNLNVIYNQIIGNSKKKVNADVINYFRELYTMENERKIHVNILNGNVINDFKADINSIDDNNEVEFF